MQSRRDFILHSIEATCICALASEICAAGNDTKATDSELMRSYRIPHTDLTASRIAYGTAMLGIDQRDPDFIRKSVGAIGAAYDNGITIFDFADIYGAGQSERALAEFLKKETIPRDRIIIQSKCGAVPPKGWVPGDPMPKNSVWMVNLSRQHIVKSVEDSLTRLGVNYLDILLLHTPDPLANPDETAQAFSELLTSGKVRYFGVSNHSVVQIELLKKYVTCPIVVSQNWISLSRRTALIDGSSYGSLVDYCRLHDILVQAYSPLKGTDLLSKPILLNPPDNASPQIKRVAHLLTEIANRHKVTPASVMIAWLLRHPAGIMPIIGATNPKHIIDNCSADRIVLSATEWTALLQSAAIIDEI